MVEHAKIRLLPRVPDEGRLAELQWQVLLGRGEHRRADDHQHVEDLATHHGAHADARRLPNAFRITLSKPHVVDIHGEDA